MNWHGEKSDPCQTNVQGGAHSPLEVSQMHLRQSHKMESGWPNDSNERGPLQRAAGFAQSYEQDPWRDTKSREAKSKNG